MATDGEGSRGSRACSSSNGESGYSRARKAWSLVAGRESGGHVYENDASGDATSVVYTNGLKLLKLTVAHKGRMNQRVGERRLGMVVIFVHTLTASYINQNRLLVQSVL